MASLFSSFALKKYFFRQQMLTFKARGYISSFVSVTCSKYSGSRTKRDKERRHSSGGVGKRERFGSGQVMNHSTQAPHVIRSATVVAPVVHFFAWIS